MRVCVCWIHVEPTPKRTFFGWKSSEPPNTLRGPAVVGCWIMLDPAELNGLKSYSLLLNMAIEMVDFTY